MSIFASPDFFDRYGMVDFYSLTDFRDGYVAVKSYKYTHLER